MNQQTVVGASFILKPMLWLPPYGRTWVRATAVVEPTKNLLAPDIRPVGATQVLNPTH